MKNACVFFLFLVAATACAVGQDVDNCEIYNKTNVYINAAGNPWWQASGTTGHAGHGTHTGAVQLGGRCIYLTQGLPLCEIITESEGNPFVASDSGGIANPLMMHAVTTGASGGAGDSNGPTISSVVTGATGASACLKAFGCTVGIIWEVKAFGVGTTVNFTNPNLGFDEHFPFQTICGQAIDPEYDPPPIPGGPRGEAQSCEAVPAVGRSALWINLQNGKNVAINYKNSCQ
jgi:hypothetical protein